MYSEDDVIMVTGPGEQAEILYPNGDKYRGKFTEGCKHGFGKYTYCGGECYEGNFERDMMHGRGRYTWDNANWYEGDFWNNKMHGKGVLTDNDGGRYEGEFRHGMFDGRGILTSSDGTIHEGMFADDVPKGPGIRTFQSGDRVSAVDFDKDTFSGVAVYEFYNGMRYVGDTWNCRPHGQGFFAWPRENLTSYAGKWVHGKSGKHRITVLKESWNYDGPYGKSAPHEDGCTRHPEGVRKMPERKCKRQRYT